MGEEHVLHFGCGAGRTLRHFLAEAQQAEFHGCDIDAKSVDWMAEHLVPPLNVFQSGEQPPLPRPDRFFDLVYALSVFTHVSDHWSEWLLELHRVLAPGAAGGDVPARAALVGLPPGRVGRRPNWHERDQEVEPLGRRRPARVPLRVVDPRTLGTRVRRSSLRTDGSRATRGTRAVLLQARPVQLTQADVREPSDDPRELAALQTNVEQLHEEAAELYSHGSAVTASYQELAASVQRN